MAKRGTGAKPLSENMLTKMLDALGRNELNSDWS